MPELIYGRNNLELVVMCYDGEARILSSQPLFDFLHGKRDLLILKEYYGQELFRILIEDAGFVRYENNKFALSVILEIDTKRTVMRMMGKIAEAVIVRRCRDNEEINLKWLRIASRKQIRLETAQKCEALGTGLESTKRKYAKNYSPSDPQRDIIWITGNGLRVQMKGSTGIVGMDAGLQVKVSNNGIAYILNDLIESRYEVPMVYFDLNGDFYKVADRLFTNLQLRGLPTLTIENDFIHAKAIDPEGYEEVCYYADLIAALVDGRITPEDLINEAEKYPTMRNAVLASAFEGMPSDTQIIH
jgi:hypothetical protein